MPCLTSEHLGLQSAPKNVRGDSPGDAVRTPGDNAQEEGSLQGFQQEKTQ